jgi:uncharacterized membrane-anchored protein YjiN (DUF445 family)
MKSVNRLAPASLIAATVLFIVTHPYEGIFTLGLLHAFAEAAMIGGLADWFAVVALFRHPLGLPIPHTAVVPKHRAKLTNGIIDMVQNRWLTKDTILERLATWNLSAALLSTLADSDSRDGLLRMLRGALTEAIRDIDDEKFARKLVEMLRTQVESDDILRWIRSLGERGMSGGWHRVLFTHAVGQAATWLGTPDIRDSIVKQLQRIAEQYADNPFRKVGKWMAESVNALNYEDLAVSIIDSLSDELRRMQQQEQHPARADFDSWLATSLAGIEEHADLRSHIEAWRNSFLDGDDTLDLMRKPIERTREWILRDLAAENSIIMQQIGSALFHALDRFMEDADAQQRVDGWLKDRIAGFVERHHSEIGGIVQRNLEKLDDEQLVRQIEEKVGSDLQYIRVNGAVVGGLVGACIYLLNYFVF